MTTPEATPAHIVEQALKRENVDPKELGSWGGMRLVKGRPHLQVGLRILLAHPIALLLAICQMAIMYIAVNDIIALYDIAQGRTANTFILHSIGTKLHALLPGLNAVFTSLLSAIPLFVVLNILVSLMAGTIANKQQPFRPTALLAGISGLIPLRFFADFMLPKWWFYAGDWRAALAIKARVTQFSIAYQLATGKPWETVEMDWANALDKHLKAIYDAYCSCLLLPNIVFGTLGLLFVIFMKIGLDWIFTLLFTLYEPLHIFMGHQFDFNEFAAIAAWLAFERACLAAMTFAYLAEPSTQKIL